MTGKKNRKTQKKIQSLEKVHKKKKGTRWRGGPKGGKKKTNLRGLVS